MVGNGVQLLTESQRHWYKYIYLNMPRGAADNPCHQWMSMVPCCHEKIILEKYMYMVGSVTRNNYRLSMDNQV